MEQASYRVQQMSRNCIKFKDRLSLWAFASAVPLDIHVASPQDRKTVPGHPTSNGISSPVFAFSILCPHLLHYVSYLPFFSAVYPSRMSISQGILSILFSALSPGPWAGPCTPSVLKRCVLIDQMESSLPLHREQEWTTPTDSQLLPRGI